MESQRKEESAFEIENVMILEKRLGDLFFDIGSKLSNKVKSFQLMRDDDFVHRKDRTTNDIHLFCELKNGQYFHLRAYTRHMLATKDNSTNKVFLTGYLKDSIEHTGGIHSFKQGWYDWNEEIIINEILHQNSQLFQ